MNRVPDIELDAQLDASDRIIDVCPPDPSMSVELHRRGLDRYLALVPPSRLAPIRAAAGDLAPRFVGLGSIGSITRNNADVLVLHDKAVRHLWTPVVGRARLLLVPTGGRAGLEAALAIRVGRWQQQGQVTCGELRYRVLSQPQDLHPVARHYASPEVGLEHLPELLDERGIDYVVLRWFEALPHLDEGEDLDVLVRDAHLDDLRSILDDRPGTIPVDVYSESGLPGSDHQGVAYYPPALASDILDRSRTMDNGYRVPSPPDHFRSLAYHALYHKGRRSGLPSSDSPSSTERPEHDYRGVLESLAERTGLDLPITVEALDDHLYTEGWRPPRDTLAKLSRSNDWVRNRFFAKAPDRHELPLPGAFILRERAADQRWIDLAHEVLEEHGFEVIATHRIAPSAQRRAASEIRGGNWGPGPYPVSGGGPAVVIVALDHEPIPPTEAQLAEHPMLVNARTLTAKYAFRDRFLAATPPEAHCNPIHSSDDVPDAWEYIRLTIPGELPQLSAAVDEHRARLASTGPTRWDPYATAAEIRSIDQSTTGTPAPPISLRRRLRRLLGRARRVLRRLSRAALRRWVRWRTEEITIK